jgi:hypothetical protein
MNSVFGNANLSESASVFDLDIFSSLTDRPDRYKVGRVRIADRKVIQLLNSTGVKAPKLLRAVEEMNQREFLEIDIEAEIVNDQGDRVLTHSSMLVPKGHEDFIQAVKNVLRSDYGFAAKDVLIIPGTED